MIALWEGQNVKGISAGDVKKIGYDQKWEFY